MLYSTVFSQQVMSKNPLVIFAALFLQSNLSDSKLIVPCPHRFSTDFTLFLGKITNWRKTCICRSVTLHFGNYGSFCCMGKQNLLQKQFLPIPYKLTTNEDKIKTEKKNI